MAIKLPTKKRKPITLNPKVTVMYSKPKVGKSSAVSKLEDNLILDLEGSCNHLEGFIMNINNLADLREIGREIVKQEYPYKYITVDTITKLEEMSLGLAAQLYKATPMGRSWTGTDVATLPNGAGFKYWRDAFFKVLNEIQNWAPHIILIAHLKDKLIGKKGEEINAMDLELMGKSKFLVAANADAIGYLYRKDNQCIINFNANNDNIVVGARPPHLRNKEVILSEMGENGELTTYWNKIFKPE